jgi:hypothetical protein
MTNVAEAPRVATVHDAIKDTIRAHLTLVHVFHTIPHTGLSVVSLACVFTSIVMLSLARVFVRDGLPPIVT